MSTTQLLWFVAAFNIALWAFVGTAANLLVAIFVILLIVGIRFAQESRR